MRHVCILSLEKVISVISILLLLISLVLFSLLHTDISKLGTVNIDLTKWLDVGFYLWQWAWYSLIAGTVLNILAFVLRMKKTN